MVSQDHSLKGIKMTRRSDIYDNSTCTLYALFIGMYSQTLIELMEAILFFLSSLQSEQIWLGN